MEARQSYAAPTSGASPFLWPDLTAERTFFTPAGEPPPSLPQLIEQLQNLYLLSLDIASPTYQRSIERLTQNVADSLALLDDDLLTAITPGSHD